MQVHVSQTITAENTAEVTQHMRDGQLADVLVSDMNMHIAQVPLAFDIILQAKTRVVKDTCCPPRRECKQVRP